MFVSEFDFILEGLLAWSFESNPVGNTVQNPSKYWLMIFCKMYLSK